MADDPDAARPRPARRGRRRGDDDAVRDPDAVTPPVDETEPEATAEPKPEPGRETEVTAEPKPEPGRETEARAEAEPEPEATAEPDGATSDEPAPDQVASDESRPDEPEAETEAAEAPPDTATSLWETVDGTPTASLPWLQARSPDDRICPFLRAVAADDHLGFPVESPDAANRCASMHEAVPQSLRQQELVCLTANHVNCPRYLRGAASSAVPLTEAVAPRVRPKAVMTPAISAALIILALSFGASVAFGLANGGLALPSKAAVVTQAPSASSVAVGPSVRPSLEVTASPSPAPTASLTPSPSASAAASPSSSPSASPSTAPTPSASAVASGPTPSPSAVSARTKLLTPCPNKPDCWIYTVRSGDNLFSIAKYFGVPLSTVRRLNPWTKTESLRAGKKLILPNPTR